MCRCKARLRVSGYGWMKLLCFAEIRLVIKSLTEKRFTPRVGSGPTDYLFLWFMKYLHGWQNLTGLFQTDITFLNIFELSNDKIYCILIYLLGFELRTPSLIIKRGIFKLMNFQNSWNGYGKFCWRTPTLWILLQHR